MIIRLHSFQKIALFALLTALPFLSFGQKRDEIVKIFPKWSVGDKRDIHVDRSTKVSYNDSIVQNTNSSYDVKLKILETKPKLILRWSSTNTDLYVHKDEIPGQKDREVVLQKALTNAEYEVLSSSFKLEMNAKSGEITVWTNGLELLKNAEFHQKKVLKNWCNENNTQANKRLEIELEFSKRLNEGYQIWKEILLAKVNSVFAAYQVGFVMNNSISEEIFTGDILHLNDADTEFPGTLTKEASEVNDKLILDKKLMYNKEFITTYLRKMSGSLSDLSPNEVMIFENEQSIIDLKTNWLLSHTKKLYFEVKGMKTTSRTTTTFH